MKKKEIAVGGQAVIEGVMMRGPDAIATAIRRKDKTIEVKKETFVSITKKIKILGLPIIRGFVSLIEMMKIGFQTLTFSASRFELDFEEETQKKAKWREKVEEIFSFVFAFGLAFILFAYLPYQISDWVNIGKSSIYFNLIAGLIRITFFGLYVWGISWMNDVKRLFAYHGAEHKTVFAYEKNQKLEAKEIQQNSTLHPRCGTSFMFFVLLVSILIFSVADTLLMFYGKSALPFIFSSKGTLILYYRLGFHLLLLPIVSGVSYEILRYSGKKINHPIVKLMTVPGMALQRITTNQPDDEQVEIATVALKAALDLPLDDHQNIQWIEE
jgi:uncharacterized protein YqhQ